MQFHVDGFRSGDPAVADALPKPCSGDRLPGEVDVLIVGCGPAGLTLAAQLSVFPDITTAIIEKRSGPLTLGQADGIACRTMEMFQAFGFADQVAAESFWVNEVLFWKPGPAGEIVRSGRVQDVEDGLSEMPHVILNQARIHDRFLQVMHNGPHRMAPFYGREIVTLIRSADAEDTHPVTATIAHVDADGTRRMETVRARYVVGCDGARSVVRSQIGRTLEGDSANQAWGVMDILAVTDFPDIRNKCPIQSEQAGNILIIPREGGYLTRIYVELDQIGENERIADRNITAEQLIATAQRIMAPYSLDVKEVVWWSCYVIGQRLCSRFDDTRDGPEGLHDPRIFIAGDACHTHSPKAGQGMNVSMQDAFNLGWKLAAVLRGTARPELLATYSAERQAIAQELIDFDREWAKMFSAPARNAERPEAGGVDPAEFQRNFVRQGRFTAGTATHYPPSLVCGDGQWQHLATGLVVGMRLHSARVVRLADAKPLHLGHEVIADGRWRLFLFAGADDTGLEGGGVSTLCAQLAQSPRSPLAHAATAGSDVDALLDVRAIFQQPHHALAIERMPSLLRPPKGRYGLYDYEKVFCAEPVDGADIYDMRGIDRAAGCMVLVRPDQYIAHVLPLTAFDQLADFMGAILPDPV